MSKTVWNKGAPPSIGWWPADMYKNSDVIRWWDGKHWWGAAFDYWTASEAADTAHFMAICQESIEWTERWWL